MSAHKMLVGDKDTVLLIPAFEIDGVPRLALPSTASYFSLESPTAALLNYYIGILNPGDSGAAWGGNVTCSIIDDMTLNLTDSATDDTRTLCSIGQSQDLTFYNYDGSMNFLRDVDPTDATSTFNLPINLTSGPDIPYVIAHRIGYKHNTAAAIGQEWNLYYFWTDHPVPASSDGDNLSIGETFIAKGLVNFKYELVA
jgi:hypothetical protein